MGKKEIVKKLKERANAARCDLAWLAAIHWGVRRAERLAIENAANILDGEDSFNEEKLEGIFNKFIEFYKKNKKKRAAPSDDAGHYLNKSAIVYADAIIQAFLDDSSLIFSQTYELQNKSIGSKLDELDKKIRELLSYREVCSAKHVRFMAQLRHVITHNSGRVDEKFIEVSTKKGKLYDETIWSEEKFERVFAKGNQVGLDVGRVVIPYLKHAFDFVDDHTKQLIKCLYFC